MTDQGQNMTDQEKREAFSARYKELCGKAAEVLHEKGMHLYDRLASSERKSFLEDPGNYRLAKIILCTLPTSTIVFDNFAAESMRLPITRCKRIYNSRIG